jgi:phage baseplate assembly protein gpV
VRSLKNTISEVLTHVYNALFLGEDISQYMASEYRRRKLRLGAPRRDGERSSMPAPLLTEDDLYVVDAIKRVRVTFAKKASETPEELYQMFALGAIDQRVLCAELARRNNFDPSQLCQNEDGEEIPLQMRRFLIPQFADAIKFEFEQKKHKDTLSLQKQQMQAQERQAKDQLGAQKQQNRLQADVQIETAKAQAKAGIVPGGGAAGSAGTSKPAAKSSTGAGGGGAVRSAGSTPSSSSTPAKKKAKTAEKK